MSFLAGLSTVIGAGVVFLLPGGQASPAQMSFVLALAFAVMVSATMLEFWLPLLITFSLLSAVRVLSFSAIGAFAFVLFSKCMPDPCLVDLDIENSPSVSVEKCDPLKCGLEVGEKGHEALVGVDKVVEDRSWHLAKVLLLSLTAHNFPEGFAVAVSSLGSDSAGFVVMIAIAMHNIPEGIAIAVPVLAATGSRKKALWMTFLSGMAEPLGALIALLLVNTIGAVTEDNVENLLCVVGGIMVAVAFQELLPAAWNHDKPVSFINGSLLGCLLMVATISYGA
jgi:ZIP family zinc transporter